MTGFKLQWPSGIPGDPMELRKYMETLFIYADKYEDTLLRFLALPGIVGFDISNRSPSVTHWLHLKRLIGKSGHRIAFPELILTHIRILCKILAFKSKEIQDYMKKDGPLDFEWYINSILTRSPTPFTFRLLNENSLIRSLISNDFYESVLMNVVIEYRNQDWLDALMETGFIFGPRTDAEHAVMAFENRIADQLLTMFYHRPHNAWYPEDARFYINWFHSLARHEEYGPKLSGAFLNFIFAFAVKYLYVSESLIKYLLGSSGIIDKLVLTTSRDLEDLFEDHVRWGYYDVENTPKKFMDITRDHLVDWVRRWSILNWTDEELENAIRIVLDSKWGVNNPSQLLFRVIENTPTFLNYEPKFEEWISKHMHVEAVPSFWEHVGWIFGAGAWKRILHG
jgi:hypothetical protein